jgi:hypothetical protein
MSKHSPEISQKVDCPEKQQQQQQAIAEMC